MGKLEKTFQTVENDLKKVTESIKGPFNSVVEFIKSHKKLIATLVVVYLVYRYLFSEEE